MAEKKKEASVTAQKTSSSHSFNMFTKDNYLWMLGGIVIMAIGLFLMAGGASKDPNVFDKEEVYSTTRITIAPILILAGFVIEIFAIFRKPKQS